MPGKPANMIEVSLGRELLAVARAHCDKHHITMAQLARSAFALYLDRPELEYAVKLGPPKRNAPVTA